MIDGYSNFVKACESKGVKPFNVSKETGVSTATLTSWKKGKYVPKADKLKLIADFLGVTVEYLQGIDDTKGWYINEETAAYAQELFERKEMRILFDAAKDCTEEDLMKVVALLESLKRNNE